MSISREEFEKKIIFDHGEIRNDEWIKMFEEAKKFDDWNEFKYTLAGNILCQTASQLIHNI